MSLKSKPSFLGAISGYDIEQTLDQYVTPYLAGMQASAGALGIVTL